MRAFLFTTARNLALNHLRRHRLERPEGMGAIDLLRVLDDKVDTPEAVSRLQEIEILHEALQSLPERCREVFTLRRIYGLSQREIAQRLGLSEKTVENHSVTALKKCTEFFRRREASSLRSASEKKVTPQS